MYMFTWLADLRNRGLSLRLALMAAAVAAAFGLTVPVALHIGGVMAVTAAALAAGLCLLGAGSALFIGDRLRGPHIALAALLLGMILRMGLPLTAGLIIHLHGGPLAQAGLLWYLVVFYPITLTVGTILSLPPKGESQHLEYLEN